MSNIHGKSWFGFVASVVGASLMTGVVSAAAQTAAPADNVPAAPVAKPLKKKVAPAIIVVVTNSRAVALTELDAKPSGGTLPKAIVSNLAPGKKISVTVATGKSCVFDLHGTFVDGASADLQGINLCKDKNVNLVE